MRIGLRITVPFLALLALSASGTVRANAGLFEPGVFPNLTGEAAATDVAVADLDGNGTLDLYVSFGNLDGAAGEQTPVRDVVLLNKGGAFFFDAGVPLDGAAPETGVGVALADFDRDGLPDAAVAGGSAFQGGNVVVSPSRLYRNTGGANLVPAGTLGASVARVAIAAADWDVDGDVDLALVAPAGVDFFRNDSVVGSGAFTFVLAQQVTPAGGDVVVATFGQFAGDAHPDLALLRDPPQGVLVLDNVGGATPFSAGQDIALPGVPRDLAAGDLDGNGLDDLVVVTGPAGPGPIGDARIFDNLPGGLVDSGFRFPEQAYRAALIADLDGVSGLDVALSKQRCDGPTCASADFTTLSVWLAGDGAYIQNGQCLGHQAITSAALVAARLDGDAALDLVLLGRRDPGQPGSDGIDTFLNDAGPLAAQCCLAQYAAEFGEYEGAPTARPKAAAAVDLAAYGATRDALMSDAVNGARLRARYEQFSPELVQRMLLDPTLWDDAAQTLTLWSGPLRALVDGDGGQAVVSAAMIDSVDALLQRFTIGGTPALGQAIAEERALLPPFASFVGLTMDEFRDLTLPRDTLLRDGFESEP